MKRLVCVCLVFCSFASNLVAGDKARVVERAVDRTGRVIEKEREEKHRSDRQKRAIQYRLELARINAANRRALSQNRSALAIEKERQRTAREIYSRCVRGGGSPMQCQLSTQRLLSTLNTSTTGTVVGAPMIEGRFYVSNSSEGTTIILGSGQNVLPGQILEVKRIAMVDQQVQFSLPDGRECWTNLNISPRGEIQVLIDDEVITAACMSP